MTPNPITPEAFSTAGQGLTLTGTNWFPGSNAYIIIHASDGTEVFNDITSFIVDANGDISVTVVLPTAPGIGTYYVEFDDCCSGPAEGFYYETGVLDHYEMLPGNDAVWGLPLSVAAAAPTLAATGADPALLIAGGSLVLLVGAALLMARTRIQRQHG